MNWFTDYRVKDLEERLMHANRILLQKEDTLKQLRGEVTDLKVLVKVLRAKNFQLVTRLDKNK